MLIVCRKETMFETRPKDVLVTSNCTTMVEQPMGTDGCVQYLLSYVNAERKY